MNFGCIHNSRQLSKIIKKMVGSYFNVQIISFLIQTFNHTKCTFDTCWGNLFFIFFNKEIKVVPFFYMAR